MWPDKGQRDKFSQVNLSRNNEARWQFLYAALPRL